MTDFGPERKLNWFIGGIDNTNILLFKVIQNATKCLQKGSFSLNYRV